MNRTRFTDGVDILDLKSVNEIDRDFLIGLGFSNSSIANANNIYLLSERGYSKLLKILEDDFAWEQFSLNHSCPLVGMNQLLRILLYYFHVLPNSR